LDWWPVTRDCSFYLVVAITLTWVVWDGQVEVHETIVLLILYILYFVIMFTNRKIIRFLQTKFELDISDNVTGKLLCKTGNDFKIILHKHIMLDVTFVLWVHDP